MNEFDQWNEVKKETNSDDKCRNFKEREIFYIKMGQNIGFEQNGKGEQFIRPVIILKKFNKNMFLAYQHPVSSKKGCFITHLVFLNLAMSAII